MRARVKFEEKIPVPCWNLVDTIMFQSISLPKSRSLDFNKLSNSIREEKEEQDRNC